MRGSRSSKGLRTGIVFGAIFAVQIVIGLLLGSSFFSDQAQATAAPASVQVVDQAPIEIMVSDSSLDEVVSVDLTTESTRSESTSEPAGDLTLLEETDIVASATANSFGDRSARSIAVTVSNAATAQLQSITVISSPVSVFPVVGGGPFSPSFGAPRPSGRSHKGNDIIAGKMTPVVAVAAGTVVGAPDAPGEGCCNLKVRHPDGSHTVYIHLNNDTPGTDDGKGWGLADGIAVGAHVEAGTVIGYVGDSGNAEDTAPHLHFEYHPPGSDAVDPYELLRDAPLLASVEDAGPAVTVEADELPYTGASPGRLTLFAATCLVLGALLLTMSRWSAPSPPTKPRLCARSASWSPSEGQAEVPEAS